MASCESTTVVDAHQSMPDCSSSMELAHAQPMNIAKKGFGIKVDFLARALERTLRAIATTQNIPYLRSAQVRMSDLGCATVQCREQTA